MKSLIFFALLGAMLWGVGNVLTSAGPAEAFSGETVRVDVEGVFVSPASMSPVVVLAERSGRRTLPIWVGYLEAEAIRRNLEGERQPRPMTHDLLGEAVTSLGGEVRRIVVTHLDDGTFYARVHLGTASDTLSLDARPSDAIALALGVGAPIFVSRQLLEEEGEVDPLHGGADEIPLGSVGCGLFCQPLDAELAIAMGVEEGVLVADVAGAPGDEGVRRGDVIVSIGGQPADTVDRVEELLSGLDEGDALPATVVRGDEQVDVTLTCR